MSEVNDWEDNHVDLVTGEQISGRALDNRALPKKLRLRPNQRSDVYPTFFEEGYQYAVRVRVANELTKTNVGVGWENKLWSGLSTLRDGHGYYLKRPNKVENFHRERYTYNGDSASIRLGWQQNVNYAQDLSKYEVYTTHLGDKFYEHNLTAVGVELNTQILAANATGLIDHKRVAVLKGRTAKVGTVNGSANDFFEHKDNIVPGDVYAYQVFAVGKGSMRSPPSDIMVARAVACPQVDTLVEVGKLSVLHLGDMSGASWNVSSLNVSFAVRWHALTLHDVGYDDMDSLSVRVVSSNASFASRSFNASDGVALSVQVDDLAPATEYVFRLQLVNSVCSVDVAVERFSTPSLPALPEGVRRVRLTLDKGLRNPSEMSGYG